MKKYGVIILIIVVLGVVALSFNFFRGSSSQYSPNSPEGAAEIRRVEISFGKLIYGNIVSIEKKKLIVSGDQPVGISENGPYTFEVSLSDATEISTTVVVPADEYKAAMKAFDKNPVGELPKMEKQESVSFNDVKVGDKGVFFADKDIGKERTFTAVKITIIK